MRTKVRLNGETSDKYSSKFPTPGLTCRKQMPDPGNKYSWECPTNARGGGGGVTMELIET
jgi:hypothetical protein